MRDSATPERWGAAWWPVVRVVATNPSLWRTAVLQLFRLAAPGWWRRRPFLPLPDPAYLRFRLETMYGGDVGARVEPADLVAYLRWCRTWPTS